ncbi:HTH-type transcriptional regulatory protein GabR [bioreactor metagenome]|uniref:HTH-type transcriptional regulatory protein GabR n=1 Tax=bioreactor metagenome TaxID=1076179 RepID=A0A645BL44_9ZZZZ
MNFDSGIPALELFPRGKWNQAVSRAFLDAPVSALGYDDPQGRPELRRALAAYLEKTRGFSCDPDQIIITAGAKQGLTLIAKCLLDQNSQVLVEDPTNANVRQIFSYHTEHLLPVPVDGQGMITQELPQGGTPGLIFVTPSHQFPMGGILPLQRRLELIRYARQKGCWLIEDDYDSEFRYDGTPVRSLFELDNQRVIYIGTFSKVLFPSLRLGYLVLPRLLVEQCLTWKRLADHHSNSVYQLALASFIESRALEKHIAHMKKIYDHRRGRLLELLDQHFAGRVRIYGGTAGMHVVAEFQDAVFTPELIQRIRTAGAYLVPVEKHSVLGGHENQVILGYAQLSPEEMERGLLMIKSCIGGAKM